MHISGEKHNSCCMTALTNVSDYRSSKVRYLTSGSDNKNHQVTANIFKTQLLVRWKMLVGRIFCQLLHDSFLVERKALALRNLVLVWWKTLVRRNFWQLLNDSFFVRWLAPLFLQNSVSGQMKNVSRWTILPAVVRQLPGWMKRLRFENLGLVWWKTLVRGKFWQL